jgi:hypothetical protein
MESPAPLGAEAIIRIWERGRYEHPVDRALTILSCLTQRPRQELAELSVERRDIALLEWRSRLFGEDVGGYAACPQCGCGVDVSLTVGGLAEPDECFAVEAAGVRVMAHLPTSLDLAAAAGCESVEAARRMLVRRCIGDGPAGEASTANDGTVDSADMAAAVEAELDRRAGISAGGMRLTCPDCGHGWDVEFDVAAFAWREIEVLARRLLLHVDVLARRYGWSEQEILRLSPARRAFYLELAS